MEFWLIFSFINLIICLADIYRQGFCKAIDLLSTLVMFLAGPFATSLVLLHYNSNKVNSILESVIWQKKSYGYNDFLEEQKRKKNER